MAKSPVRLFDLKKWLTLEDAARHLSVLFGEDVVVADVLRLALDGHLTLSINLVNKARAREGRLVALEDCLEITATPDTVKSALIKSSKLSMAALREGFADLVASFKLAPAGFQFTDEEWLVLEEEVVTIDGVWDLPLHGAERLDVEHRFQQETDGPEVTLVNLNGAFVRRDDVVCQLQEILKGRTVEAGGMTLTTKDSNIPAAGLPENAALVVRTAALREFEQALAAGVDKKALDPREQKTLLCIIGALAKAAKVDISQPYKAGAAIEKMLSDQKVSARRIGDHLKLVPDALADRKI
jgi:hypothetical protein